MLFAFRSPTPHRARCRAPVAALTVALAVGGLGQTWQRRTASVGVASSECTSPSATAATVGPSCGER